MIGIYKITNPENKIYIGYTTDLYKRKSYYKLNKGIGQTKLYNSIIQYGWDKHKIELMLKALFSGKKKTSSFLVKYSKT